LAPSSGVSADLASTATLGQTPFAPTSAKERGERKEDRVVRRVLGKKGELLDDEESESEVDEHVKSRMKGKGKEKATETIIEGGNVVNSLLAPIRPKGSAVTGNEEGRKKRKSKVSKQVCCSSCSHVVHANSRTLGWMESESTIYPD